nr:MAG TPA: hypothetical protein [Caudoviricetes sp.]
MTTHIFHISSFSNCIIIYSISLFVSNRQLLAILHGLHSSPISR